jgi:aconitase B
VIFVIATKGKKNTITAKIVIVFLNAMKAKTIVVGARSAEQKKKGASHMSKEITLTDFTNSELDYLAEMIHEKLQNMGHDPDGGFSFDVIVHFEEEE